MHGKRRGGKAPEHSPVRVGCRTSPRYPPALGQGKQSQSTDPCKVQHCVSLLVPACTAANGLPHVHTSRTHDFQHNLRIGIVWCWGQMRRIPPRIGWPVIVMTSILLRSCLARQHGWATQANRKKTMLHHVGLQEVQATSVLATLGADALGEAQLARKDNHSAHHQLHFHTHCIQQRIPYLLPPRWPPPLKGRRASTCLRLRRISLISEARDARAAPGHLTAWRWTCDK